MNPIHVVPEQSVEIDVLERVETCLADTFGLPIHRMPSFKDPLFAFDTQRGQYSSTEILRWLTEKLPPGATALLAIVDRDIFIPMLTFVFGQAQLGGSLALVSLARLRQECYGLPPNPDLLLQRACKETVHELGHTFGLVHCRDPRCVMSLSISIEQVDAKRATFCAACRMLLRDSLEASAGAAAGPGGVQEDSHG